MQQSVIIILFLFASTLTFAQGKSCYNIDSSKIQKNENLQAFIDSLQVTELKTENSKKRIPRFIKKTLDCWTNGFDIANPDKRYQATDVHKWRLTPLPRRQLTYLGVHDRYLIMTYKKGGWGQSSHLLLFKFNKGKITDFWAGGNADLSSQKDVLYFLVYYKDKVQFGSIDL